MNINPDHDKAMALAASEQHQEAIVLFTSLIGANPKEADLYNDRGVSWYHLNENDKALADMNLAVSLEPDYGYRYSARAFIKNKMGDVNGAIDDYAKAVKLDPEDAIALNNMGMLEEKVGYMDKAKKHFAEADKLAEEMGMLGYDPEVEATKQSSIGVQKIDKQGKSQIKPEPLPQVKLPEVGKVDKPSPEPSTLRIMGDVFKKKEAFRDFMKFVRSGFRNSDPA